MRAALLLALLTTACNASTTPVTPAPLPVRGTPAHIDLTAQPGLNANGGTATVTARVSDAFAALLPDVAVSFSATAGSFTSSPVTTDANGLARAILTAPSGAVQVTAHAGSIDTAPVLVAIQPNVAPPSPTPSPTPPDPAQPPGALSVTMSAAVAQVGSASVFLALVTNQSAGAPSFTWTFGDGQTAVSLSPSTAHTYAAIGTYPVSLSVRDSAGRVASASTIATVIAVIPPPPPPTPTPSYGVVLTASPASVNTGVATTLMATVTPVNGAPTASTFAWDCGNGTTVTNGSATQPCTYSTVGSMNARVTVSNGTIVGFGATTVTVTAPPVPIVTITCNVVAHGTPTDCFATAAISGSGAAVASVTWDWGDGGPTSTTPNGHGTHTYAVALPAPGFHVVGTATVTGASSPTAGSANVVVQ